MKNVECCIICGSTNLINYDTMCSQFLAERIWNSKSFNVKLSHCNNCDFTFYNPRPDDKELDRLYNGYRSNEYQKQREKYESYYTKDFNESIVNDIEIDGRKLNMSSIINKYINIKEIHNLLDYGGDKGQFITDDFKFIDRYIFDISNVDILPGIKKINYISESDNKKFDFIMCCHVLEHVSNPSEIINNILKFSHNGTKFYFELPYDSHKVLTPIYINIFFKFFKMNSFIYKLYFKLIKRMECEPLFQMHEHINYFSIKSLQRLLELNGLKVEYISIKKLPLTMFSEMLCCYATKDIIGGKNE